MSLILRWLAAAAGVWVAANFVPGIRVEGGFTTLLVVALILGLANAVVRPILKGLACGLIVLTLGLFLFVINALMLLLTSLVARQLGYGFEVDGFVPALLGSIVISLVTWAASVVFSGDRER